MCSLVIFRGAARQRCHSVTLKRKSSGKVSHQWLWPLHCVSSGTEGKSGIKLLHLAFYWCYYWLSSYSNKCLTGSLANSNEPDTLKMTQDIAVNLGVLSGLWPWSRCLFVPGSITTEHLGYKTPSYLNVFLLQALIKDFKYIQMNINSSISATGSHRQP